MIQKIQKMIALAMLMLSMALGAQTIPDNVVKENTYTVTGTENIFATQSITLKPNTWIQAGSTFRAKIIKDPYIPLNLSNENYVLTRLFQIETTSTTVDENKDVIENITYLDGLGRAIQSIAIKQSPLQKDIISFMTYDGLGRQVKEYLPYGSTQNTGAIVADPLTPTENYYNTHYASDMDIANPNPYSEKTFENSPLNRVFEQAAPGDAWKKTGTNITGRGYSDGHTIKFDYESNNATDNVRIYNVTTSFANNTYTPVLQGGTNFYLVGELTKMVTKDENWTPADGLNHTTEEFTNGEGQVVLKRTYADVDLNSDGDFNDAGESQVEHDTYYVYDDFGNLSYVLPPKVDTTDGISGTELSELCYQYVYDVRNRLVEKKIPGKGWEAIVYDKLDRPVLTQDALMAVQNEWLFTKYDEFGRVAYTGMYTSANSRVALQTTLDSHATVNESQQNNAVTMQDGAQVYYTNAAFPNVSTLKLFTVNYYDSYADLPTGFVAPTEVYGESVTTNTQGLATVNKVRVLETNDWITTVTYYDDKARPIYVYSENDYLQTTDIVESQLDFVGKVLEAKATHQKTGKDDIVTIDKFTYDHAGRLLEQTQQANSQVAELIASNSYDELGQLVNKGVGNVVSSSTRLQTVDYKYNVRGWLTSINNDANSDNDLFNFSLYYNNPTGNGVALFNGNISQATWNTTNIDNSTKTYTYHYDALNRIIKGIDNTSNYNLAWVSYDKNGNISNLQRKGHDGTTVISGLMDDLTYAYDAGNKLLAVNDLGDGIHGFKDGVNSSSEYTYDVNGNMTRDDNKGITAISYNHLNLPTQVSIGSQNIDYVYDATGVKQRKTVQGITTDYAGNYIYENGDLQFFSHAEGYAKIDVISSAVEISYVYQYKDHLGNVRITYADSDDDGVISAQAEIIEESNYYPFGLKHKGYNNVVSSNGNSTAQKFGFGGKELNEELGLEWMDFGARNYDASLGRWMNLDPLAELLMTHSPYNYAFNNPIFFTDPTGMLPSGSQGFTDYYDDGNGNIIYDPNVRGPKDVPNGGTYIGQFYIDPYTGTYWDENGKPHQSDQTLDEVVVKGKARKKSKKHVCNKWTCGGVVSWGYGSESGGEKHGPRFEFGIENVPTGGTTKTNSTVEQILKSGVGKWGRWYKIGENADIDSNESTMENKVDEEAKNVSEEVKKFIVITTFPSGTISYSRVNTLTGAKKDSASERKNYRFMVIKHIDSVNLRPYLDSVLRVPKKLK
ncbi:DUF6443 domain-containing protein [Pseudotenacibaculum sp. MALMAid0570]|uniref:DUF6443 domain-containing protein n=1 Tax=Pseudotenacibaculum sp. MALMAid0570 TaxID=3143938 RepID=UPI0032DE8219